MLACACSQFKRPEETEEAVSEEEEEEERALEGLTDCPTTPEQSLQKQTWAGGWTVPGGSQDLLLKSSDDWRSDGGAVLPGCLLQNQLLPPGFSRTDEMSDDLESQQLSFAAQEQHKHVHSPQGKLVIMVEDFYYGSTPQAPHTTQQSAQPQAVRTYSCVHCPQTLHSNIR